MSSLSHIFFKKIAIIRALFAVTLAISTSSCASVLLGDFVADKTLRDLAAQAPSEPPGEAERQLAQRHRVLMLVAMLGGCYERTPTGFTAKQPTEATSSSCLTLLSEVELVGQLIGAGRGPTGIESFKLPQLARMAIAGDRHAALELGIRYEEGIGLSPDSEKAKRLYRRAAADSGGTLWVHVPGVGDSPGRVMPIDQGPKIYGLREAKERLAALEKRDN